MQVEEIAFKGEAEKVGAYQTYTPPMVKMITQGGGRPPLCTVGDGLIPPTIYDVEGRKMFVFLHLIEESESWDVETPLSLCRYVKPEGEMLFNVQACEDASTENARRALHNKFIVGIFREFMPRFDCGASSNVMTMPQMPDDFVFARLEAIKELKKDKLGYAKKAIEYLAQYEMYCGLHYQFDDAGSKADDIAFEKNVEKKQATGKIRVRLEGRKPCWWDGKSDKDESGQRVKWVRGDGHTFLTPDLRVAKDEDILDVLLRVAPQQDVEGGPNPFARIFGHGGGGMEAVIEAQGGDDSDCEIVFASSVVVDDSPEQIRAAANSPVLMPAYSVEDPD